jgi:hypothetical protein
MRTHRTCNVAAGSDVADKCSAFAAGMPVFLTEKWDGTTVQATRDSIFKRTELLQRGSAAKFDSSVVRKNAFLDQFVFIHPSILV